MTAPHVSHRTWALVLVATLHVIVIAVLASAFGREVTPTNPNSSLITVFVRPTIHDDNQNAYVESFNGRLRDECLNEHWFTSLAHARAVIEEWQKEYNEERPKKSLGGLTPAQYAKQLATKAITMPEDSSSLMQKHWKRRT